MQKITVNSVEEKKSKDGTKTFYIITTEDGAELSTFNAEVAKLGKGSVIEADIEVKGKYTNINEFKVIEAKHEIQELKSYTRPADSPETRRSIERQVAAKMAFDSRAENENISATLTRAEIIYRWISQGEIPKAELAKAVAGETRKTTKVNPETEYTQANMDRYKAAVDKLGLTSEQWHNILSEVAGKPVATFKAWIEGGHTTDEAIKALETWKKNWDKKQEEQNEN